MLNFLNFLGLFNENDGEGNDAGGNASADANQEAAKETKTYTKDELTKILERETSNSYKAGLKKAQEEAKKKDMSEAERLKAEKEEAEKAKVEAEAKLADARLEAKLSGKVADPEYALFKIKAAGDTYLNKDGSPNIEAFIKDFPTQANIQSKKGPAPTKAGGGNIASSTMNDLIRSKSGRS